MRALPIRCRSPDAEGVVASLCCISERTELIRFGHVRPSVLRWPYHSEFTARRYTLRMEREEERGGGE